MNGRILILGKGYVGQALYKHLISKADINTVEIVSHGDGFSPGRGTIDYHNEDALHDFLHVFDLGKGDIVINCSGFTGRPNIDQCEVERIKTLKLNVEVPLMINKLCNELDIDYYHISSGCVYTGYEKDWTEEDEPNFGPILEETSFYSYSKYEFERQSKDCAILRLRMPFDDEFNHRSYLTKIIGYDNLISCPNSKTYLNTLVEVIWELAKSDLSAKDIGILNIVNSDALDAHDVCRILRYYDLHNENWNMIWPADLKTAAPRSNCRISNDKLKRLLPDFRIMSEVEALKQCCSTYKLNEK